MRDLIDAVDRDLTQILELTRWAYHDAYQPTNAPPARPTQPRGERIGVDYHVDELGDIVDTDRPPPTPSSSWSDPDRMPGARHDFGVGSHAARTAYRRSATPLRRADQHLVIAVYEAGVDRQPERQLFAGATLDGRCESLRIMRARLALVPDGAPKACERQLRKVRVQTDRAARMLLVVFERGEADPDQHAVATSELCRICWVRPKADRSGGRCHACAKWFTRNGSERPRNLDGPGVADAKRAQRRRLARGEGWGDESFSGARGTG